MLLEALLAYADSRLGDELASPAFAPQLVQYEVVIGDGGEFLDIVRLTRPARQEGVPDRPGVYLSAPVSPVDRASTTFALPGCDTAHYLLGESKAWTSTVKGKNEKDRRQHADHLLRLEELGEYMAADADREAIQVRDPAWTAILTWARRPEEVAKANVALSSQAKVGLPPRVILSYRDTADPTGVTEKLIDTSVYRDAWPIMYNKHTGERLAKDECEGVCLVTGTRGPIAKTHGKIKISHLGGQAAGVSLISFDKASFGSYGWEQGENAPMSINVARKYVAALNDLGLTRTGRKDREQEGRPNTRFDIATGGTVMLFWTKAPVMDQTMELTLKPDEAEIQRLLRSVRSGSAQIARLDDNDFYMLGVGANGGRLVVRFWMAEPLAEMHKRLADWFEALGVGPRGYIPSLHHLLGSIAPIRKGLPSIEDLPESAGEALLARAYMGRPLSTQMLHLALRRAAKPFCKTKESRPDNDRLAPSRISLVRLVLLDHARQQARRHHSDSPTPPFKSSLEPLPNSSFLPTSALFSGSRADPPNPSPSETMLDTPAYHCGRLLGMYVGLQEASATPGTTLNRTLADRFYRLASTHPARAFIQIGRLQSAYLGRLRRISGKGGLSVWFDRSIADISGAIEEHGGFPAHLSLVGQGEFLLGYESTRLRKPKVIDENTVTVEEEVVPEDAELAIASNEETTEGTDSIEE